jgi:quercetin dioxygenase-like cupin family protein
MQAMAVLAVAEFMAERHVEKILAEESGGDISVACWEPGQVSPYHCHPQATEIYICISGGGIMRTPTETAEIAPGSFVAHEPGELHEYENGPQRSVLFRVRYGSDMTGRSIEWRGARAWRQSSDDARYFRENPPSSKRGE